MKREQLGSRMGFIMLSAGCAIGCGNVWKFPWMCGQNGGGSFMLVYLLCLIILYYFYKFVIGQNQSLGFVSMISDPTVNVTFLFVTVAVAFVILSFHLQGGLERITKIMMTSLLILMIILAVHSLLLDGAGKGMLFYLKPDFSKINGSVVVGAMNQAFFTLSVGMGGMAIFGSYIGKERSLMGEAVHVITLDTLVAVLAGIIIFPACFTSKWMWLSSAHSQLTLPTLPRACPAVTASPSLTFGLATPHSRQMRPVLSLTATTGPHPPSEPASTTVPSVGEATVSPCAAV